MLKFPAVEPRIPKYRLHRSSGRAVVTLDGQDRYLGTHGSPESKRAYQLLIAQWLSSHTAASEPQPSDLSLDELLLAYLRFAEGYYRDAEGNMNLRFSG